MLPSEARFADARALRRFPYKLIESFAPSLLHLSKAMYKQSCVFLGDPSLLFGVMLFSVCSVRKFTQIIEPIRRDRTPPSCGVLKRLMIG